MESFNNKRSSDNISGANPILRENKAATTSKALGRNIAGSTSNLFITVEESGISETNNLRIHRVKSRTLSGSIPISVVETIKKVKRMSLPQSKRSHSRQTKDDMNDKSGGTELIIERVKERSRGRSSSESSSSEVEQTQPRIEVNGEEVDTQSKKKSKHLSGESRRLTFKKGLSKMRSNIYSEKTMQAIEGKVMNALKSGVSEGVSKGVGVPVDKFNDFIGMVGSLIPIFGSSDTRRHTVVGITSANTGPGKTKSTEKPKYKEEIQEEPKPPEEPKSASRAIFDWIYYIMDSGRILHTTYKDKGVIATGQRIGWKVFSVTTQGVGSGINYIRRSSV